MPMYPFMFVLPDGRVITVGNSEVANRTQALDVATQTWTVIDSRAIDGGSAVMFEPGKFMKAGTAADSGNSGVAASTAFVLDMSDAVPAWKPTGSMAFPRSFLNLTMLPDGTVLATGGGTDRSAFINANGVLAGGDVVAVDRHVDDDGQHGDVAAVSLDRDAPRPMAACSSAAAAPTPASRISPNAGDLLAALPLQGRAPDHRSTPTTLTYGSKFTVSRRTGRRIASVALVAPGSVTHAFNRISGS